MMADAAAPQTRPLIVIPVFNNRATLRRVVEESLTFGLPVLVVNDGSTDGGPETLDGLPVTRIDHAVNRGKGAAILSAAGWAEAHGFTHLITMDADGQHCPQDVARFLEKIAQNPWAIIVGARDVSGQPVPGASRFGRRFSNFWLKVACGMGLPDSQSGFRAYPVAILRQVRCLGRRYEFEVEILVRAVWAGASLDTVDVQVRYTPESTSASHFHPLRDNARISRTYARLVLRNFLPWPHRTLFDDPARAGERLSPKRLRHSLRVLLREHTSRQRITLAAMLGVFLGTLPLIACHSVIIVFCAARLRLNRLIALNISHFCAPPVVPALAIESGYFVRHGRWLTEFTFRTLGHQIDQRLLDYLLGSVLLAPLLALGTGFVLSGLAWSYQGLYRLWKLPATRERAACQHAPDYGGRLGYAIFHRLIRWFGVRPAYALLIYLLPYYVLCRPSARRLAAPYLKRRYPDLTAVGRFFKTVGYYYSFGRMLIDQAAMGILGPQHFSADFPSSRELAQRAQQGRGLILLTSHVGCWQAAMANMGELKLPVHFQFQSDARTAGRHFFDLAGQRDLFRIVSPQSFLGGLVELTAALHAGQCVAVMGDRAWGGRTRPARFLGDVALFPVSAYQLAVSTGADVVVLLTARTGRCAYRIYQTCITEPSDWTGLPRAAAIDLLLERYVRCLEEHLRRYPLAWFNFFDFWRAARETAC